MPFAYFGTKHRLAPSYPEPEHDTIIEPFAGAAAYSLAGDRWMRDVTLVERDPNVVAIWRYLQTATPTDIAELPDLETHVGGPYPITDPDDPRRYLMRWASGNEHGSSPNIVSSRIAKDWPRVRARIGRSLHKVRHWRVVFGNYTAAPDIEATWFVDPPYQHFGDQYTHGASGLDFAALGEWCRSRRGQIIVTEQSPADWLPFVPHRSNRNGASDRVAELIYTNTPTPTLFEPSPVVDSRPAP